MPRRTATLIASTLTLIALLCVALLMPTPYSEMSPGPTVNTLGDYGGDTVIQISGRQTYPADGHLNMTTVRVTGADYRMNLVEALMGWARHDDKVVEHDTLYPKGQTAQQADQVAKQVTKHKPGQPAVFTIVRAADAKAKSPATHQVTITTRQSHDQGPSRAVVGIAAGIEHLYPFAIDIKLADVGGPSAGMMFALGIIDKLTPGSMTGGHFVAGTGTIADDGTVGPIGGISLKTIGARDKGAQFFLTPSDNCEEAAKDVPKGLTLVKVKTLDDAMAALKNIKAGNDAVLPGCTG